MRRIYFSLTFILSTLISGAEIKEEQLNGRIIKTNDAYHLTINSPKEDTLLEGRGKYWTVRFVSFYQDKQFLGSYLLFKKTSRKFATDSSVRIPTTIKTFNRLIVKEQYWRSITGASHDSSVNEDKFIPIWRAKSSFFPATEEQLRKNTDPENIFLTQIQDLPNYYPWFRRHISGRVWCGNASIEYFTKRQNKSQ